MMVSAVSRNLGWYRLRCAGPNRAGRGPCSGGLRPLADALGEDEADDRGPVRKSRRPGCSGRSPCPAVSKGCSTTIWRQSSRSNAVKTSRPGRHLDSVDDQLGTHMVRDRPPDDGPRIAIDHRRQVHPVLPRVHIRDVRDQLGAGDLRSEIPAYQIRHECRGPLVGTGRDLPLARLGSPQAGLSHQLADQLHTALPALASQDLVDTPVPVAALVTLEDRRDVRREFTRSAGGFPGTLTSL
jgi:hypothetical protein